MARVSHCLISESKVRMIVGKKKKFMDSSLQLDQQTQNLALFAKYLLSCLENAAFYVDGIAVRKAFL